MTGSNTVEGESGLKMSHHEFLSDFEFGEDSIRDGDFTSEGSESFVEPEIVPPFRRDDVTEPPIPKQVRFVLSFRRGAKSKGSNSHSHVCALVTHHINHSFLCRQRAFLRIHQESRRSTGDETPILLRERKQEGLAADSDASIPLLKYRNHGSHTANHPSLPLTHHRSRIEITRHQRIQFRQRIFNLENLFIHRHRFCLDVQGELSLMNQIGSSVDFQRDRFTADGGFVRRGEGGKVTGGEGDEVG